MPRVPGQHGHEHGSDMEDRLLGDGDATSRSLRLGGAALLAIDAFFEATPLSGLSVGRRVQPIRQTRDVSRKTI